MPHLERSGIAIRQQERRLKVAEMRRNGSTLQQIATALGCSLRTIQRDIDSLLGDISDDQASEVEAWRLEAMDDLHELGERLWVELDRPDVNAQGVAAIAGALIKAIERTARLVGADAPQRIAVGADHAPPETIADLYERLPVRAIRRAMAEAVSEFEEAIRRRSGYDAMQAQRIADMRAESETPEPTERTEPIEPAVASPVPEPEPPAVVIPKPATRAEERRLARQIEHNSEIEAGIASFKRARNSVTGPDA